MKIDDIKINAFGKLSNKDIKLSNGINVIYGKNESGKSTLLQYITDIFYNISRTKDGKEIPDYDRFKPWDKEEFGGRLSYELDNGKKFEIYRNFNKKNDCKLYDENKDDVSCLYETDKKTGSNFFMEQTKLDKNAFCSSVVSRQQEVKLEPSSQKEIIQKITNLVSTGDDSVSFTKVIKALEDKIKKEIGTKQSSIQPINLLEKEIEKLQLEQKNLEEYKLKKYEIEDLKKTNDEEKENYKKFYNFMSDVKKLKDDEKVKKVQIDLIDKDILKNQEEINNLKLKKNQIEKEISDEKNDIVKIQLLNNLILEIKKVKDNEHEKDEKRDALVNQNKGLLEKIDSLNKSRKAVEEEIEDKKEEVYNKKNKKLDFVYLIGILLGLALIPAGIFINKILIIVGIVLFFSCAFLFVKKPFNMDLENSKFEYENQYKDSLVKIDTQIEIYEKEKNENIVQIDKLEEKDYSDSIIKEIIKKYEDNIEESEINLVVNSNNINSLYEKSRVHLDELILNNRSNEKEIQTIINKLSELPVDVDKYCQNKLKINNEIELMHSNLKDKYKNNLEIEKIDSIVNLDNIDDLYEKSKRQYEEVQLAEKKLSFDEENIIPNLEKLASNTEKIENLNEKRDEMISYRESIELAIEVLQHAYIKMKNNVTPHFSRELSNNISHITNGKYKNVRINEKDKLTVEMENGTYDSADVLSVGTIEQIYLSLRIAIISEISDENMPIILDEAFAYYDQERLKNILEYINTEFSDKQVLIFTCSNREKEILRNSNISFNEVLLETL